MLEAAPPPVWDRAFEFLMRHEGEDSDHPDDPGGQTKYGLSRRVYPTLDFDTLTLAQAKDIYFQDYWKGGNFVALPDDVAVKVFDMAVNMGRTTAIKKLQRALNYLAFLDEPLVLDGRIGRLTKHAARNVWARDPKDLMRALVGYHFDHYRRLVEADKEPFEVFAVGWLRRAFDTP